MHFSSHSKNIPVALILSALSFCALADSTSSASSAASTSIGSSSTSIEKSSGSSSGKDRVAQGQYTIMDMTALAHQPDMVRLRLKSVGDTAEFLLVLPRVATERAQLLAGQVITAEQRPYGLAFSTVATASGNTPFFLVLDDSWFRELESHPIGT